MSVRPCLIAVLREAAWAPAGVFCVFVAAAYFFDVFVRYPWIDMPSHFVGGIAIAYFFRVALARAQDAFGPIAEAVQDFATLALALGTALLWELGELACDRFFGTRLSQGAADTASDLFFGLLGALSFLAAAGLTLSRLRAIAGAALLALIALCLAWELALAPLRPGGSLAALKALPLILPLAGVVQGRRYTFQWASMLILAWFAEGVMRAWADSGLSRSLALAEIVLALVFFAAAVAYARLSRPAAWQPRRSEPL